MKIFPAFLSILIIGIACVNQPKTIVHASLETFETKGDSLPPVSGFALKLSEAALELTLVEVVYDPAYFVIPYPNGDVPSDKGVCTDVVIRAYRVLGVDLQQKVHEDMKANFNVYPKTWRLKRTDSNIDHRRVPNLMTFFSRKGITKKISQAANDYLPGDIVTWDLGGGLTHIGVVVHKKSKDQQRYQIVHNIGRGQEMEDVLFEYRITGHYFYTGS